MEKFDQTTYQRKTCRRNLPTPVKVLAKNAQNTKHLPKQLTESSTEKYRKQQLDQHMRMVRQAQMEVLSQNKPLSAASSLLQPEEPANPKDKKTA